MPARRKHSKPTATFIDCMECLPVTKLSDGPECAYEIKLDGFRLEAVRNGSVTLYSRRRNVLNHKSPYIAAALADLLTTRSSTGRNIATTREGRSSRLSCYSSFS